jgi:hypothetical protein
LQEVNRSEPTQYYGKRVGKLVVLDIRTGRSRWLEEFRGLLCVDGERIAYYTSNKLTRPASDPDDRFWITRGSIDNLVTQEVTREDTRSFDFRYSCRPESELPPMPAWMAEAKKQGRIFSRLRPEHGWLEWEKPQPAEAYRNLAKYPTRLYRPGAKADAGVFFGDVLKARLDKATDIDWTTTYVPHKDAYVLRTSHMGSQNAGVKATLWWLYPDGRLEEIVTYQRDESHWPFANVHLVVPAQASVFFVGADTKWSKHIGADGLYKIIAQAPQRVVAGRITPTVLSPDGCKLAFGNDERPVVEGTKQYKLQIVDVCEGERK